MMLSGTWNLDFADYKPSRTLEKQGQFLLQPTPVTYGGSLRRFSYFSIFHQRGHIYLYRFVSRHRIWGQNPGSQFLRLVRKSASFCVQNKPSRWILRVFTFFLVFNAMHTVRNDLIFTMYYHFLPILNPLLKFISLDNSLENLDNILVRQKFGKFEQCAMEWQSKELGHFYETHAKEHNPKLPTNDVAAKHPVQNTHKLESLSHPPQNFPKK